MILAGDIGGTKTILALAESGRDKLTLLKQETYQNNRYGNFDEILASFISPDIKLTSACFGIAGPVINQTCHMTNLLWNLSAEALKEKLKTKRVRLLNDMEAMALGMFHVPEHEILDLNPNAIIQQGNIAVIAAGTGLGEAILYWDGIQHHPLATEGGHSDFAPLNKQQDKLLAYLRRHFPDHVSFERILSGNGFGLLYDFLVEQDNELVIRKLPLDNENTDRNAVISGLGISGEDTLCKAAVDLFVEIYGAEAGNLALKSLATGGVFVGGGIAPKILPALTNGNFLRAFSAKGRYSTLLNSLSIKVTTCEQTPLLGAINYFNR